MLFAKFAQWSKLIQIGNKAFCFECLPRKDFANFRIAKFVDWRFRNPFHRAILKGTKQVECSLKTSLVWVCSPEIAKIRIRKISVESFNGRTLAKDGTGSRCTGCLFQSVFFQRNASFYNLC